MIKIRQIFSVAGYNFRMWYKNPRIILVFALAFILCFLLSDKAVRFAVEYETTMQIFESFVWTFGDSNSVMLSSLLLIMLFSDMPFLGAAVPFYLYRVERWIWLAGQFLYIGLGTVVYMLFILFSTIVCSARMSFSGDLWSETAAILGYSGAGRAVAIPALVKTLEMSTPYQCTIVIFFLMLFYMLLLMSIMMSVTIKKGSLGGVISVCVFSIYGFLINPSLFKNLLNLNDQQAYVANLWAAWLSPLQHATYNMHNFGYDKLPQLWMTFTIFTILIIAFFRISLQNIHNYNYCFARQET